MRKVRDNPPLVAELQTNLAQMKYATSSMIFPATNYKAPFSSVVGLVATSPGNPWCFTIKFLELSGFNLIPFQFDFHGLVG